MTVLLALPVVLPLLGAAVSLTMSGRRRVQRILGVAVCAATLGNAGVVLQRVDAGGTQATQLGGWPAPIGITLVAVHAGGARGKALADALRAAGAEVTECQKLTRFDERVDFVRAEVRKAGGKISQDAVSVLIDAVGTDLRELTAAASQLVADAGGTIDDVAVRRYHRGRAEVTGFAVGEKAVSGDRAAALEALRWALTVGVAPVLVADALADAVRTVARVGAAGRGDPYRLAGQLGMPPWKVRKAQAQARGWRPDGLATALAVVAEVNADVKGAAPDAGYALERAVLRVAAARSGT